MTNSSVIGGVLAACVVGALGWGYFQASQPQPDVFQGQMEARETDVAPKVPGRIADVLVREGDAVTVGRPLIRMDSPEVDAKLAQASAAQAAADSVAAKARHGARAEEIEMARLNWQRAEAAAQLAETSFKRVQGLARDGLLAAQKRDEAEANARASRDAARAAEAQYRMARQGARSEDRDAAAAQARQVAGVVAEVQAAKAETELKSPVAGEVAKVLARPGELSPQGVAVVTVVDLKDQWLVLHVREDKLQRFGMGAKFEGELPALPGQRATFQVFQSSPLPDFATWRATRGNQGFDARTFEVKARPLKPIAGMRPGMSVLVH